MKNLRVYCPLANGEQFSIEYESGKQLIHHIASDDWSAPPTRVQVMYPSSRHLSPKVKTFVEHLQERMTPPPWELRSKR